MPDIVWSRREDKGSLVADRRTLRGYRRELSPTHPRNYFKHHLRDFARPVLRGDEELAKGRVK
jgi:hypothetical protein